MRLSHTTRVVNMEQIGYILTEVGVCITLNVWSSGNPLMVSVMKQDEFNWVFYLLLFFVYRYIYGESYIKKKCASIEIHHNRVGTMKVIVEA